MFLGVLRRNKLAEFGCRGYYIIILNYLPRMEDPDGKSGPNSTGWTSFGDFLQVFIGEFIISLP